MFNNRHLKKCYHFREAALRPYIIQRMKTGKAHFVVSLGVSMGGSGQ